MQYKYKDEEVICFSDAKLTIRHFIFVCVWRDKLHTK